MNGEMPKEALDKPNKAQSKVENEFYPILVFRFELPKLNLSFQLLACVLLLYFQSCITRLTKESNYTRANSLSSILKAFIQWNCKYKTLKNQLKIRFERLETFYWKSLALGS